MATFIYTSHPIYACPVMDLSSDCSDCQYPLLTCMHGIACSLLNVEVMGGPINCLSDLSIEAPNCVSDQAEIQALICCAQKFEQCLSDLYGLENMKIHPTCTAYCGPVAGSICVNIRRCEMWIREIFPPFSDCSWANCPCNC